MVVAALVLIVALVPASVVGGSVAPVGAYVPTEKLFRPEAGAPHGFGMSMAVDGDTLVVGATDPGGDGQGAEAVHVYQLTDAGIWEQGQTLPAPGGSGTGFGWSVAIDDGLLVVGAPWTDTSSGIFAGSAYVYERGPEGSWSQVAELLPGDGTDFTQFGATVAFEGTTVAVGSVEQGNVYVFERSGGSWTEDATLSGAGFGRSLAMEDSVLAIGASDSVHLFERGGSGWVETATVDAVSPGKGFGHAVALDGNGDRLVVGAPRAKGHPDLASTTGADAGSAYVYEAQPGDTWMLEATLIPEDSLPLFWDQRFGAAVTIAGDRILVGAERDDASLGSAGVSTPKQGLVCVALGPVDACQSPGAAYLFGLGDEGWRQTNKLTAPDGSHGDGFGRSVALPVGGTIVGAPGSDLTTGLDEAGPGQDVGAAYVFTSPLEGVA